MGMMSGGAEKLRAVLQREPGRLLCLPCVGTETGLNVYEARKAVRELILRGGVLASPQGASSCQRVRPILKLGDPDGKAPPNRPRTPGSRRGQPGASGPLATEPPAYSRGSGRDYPG